MNCISADIFYNQRLKFNGVFVIIRKFFEFYKSIDFSKDENLENLQYIL